MSMPAFIEILRMAVAVGAAFRLKGSLQLYQFRAKATEHILNYMVGSNAKYLVSDIGW
jgi:hypothetical protein